jgi:hypothetical protein
MSEDAPESVAELAFHRKRKVLDEAPTPLAWFLKAMPVSLFVGETWVAMAAGGAAGMIIGGVVL